MPEELLASSARVSRANPALGYFTLQYPSDSVALRVDQASFLERSAGLFRVFVPSGGQMILWRFLRKVEPSEPRREALACKDALGERKSLPRWLPPPACHVVHHENTRDR